ncbi:50S ribosomal protein L9 [Candidatus Parcubacteria bacterium]|jgi:large subunit ribosomal protein L9|nr:50S ribosomal protein L9 [Candidatus Parcubacteria bacterium]
MKVVLLETIKSLGVKGDIKEVSDGYAINYLIPQKKVALATSVNVGAIQAKEAKAQQQVQEQSDEYQKVVKTLSKQTIGFSRKVSDKETLFKGVSIKDIVVEIKNNFSLDINTKWFKNSSVIKTLGRHEVFLNLPNSKTISFYINIKAE